MKSIRQKKFYKKLFLFAQLTLVLLCGIWYLHFQNNQEKQLAIVDPEPVVRIDTPANPLPATDADSFEATPITSFSNPISVTISGAVNQPGSYSLDALMTIESALKAAGGATDKADLDLLPQTMLLMNASSLYVPEKGETLTQEVIQYASNDLYQVKGDFSKDGLVNINAANHSQLVDLPGIGDVKASAIITYRQTHGDFNTVEELKRVPGISSSLFSSLQDKVYVP